MVIYCHKATYPLPYMNENKKIVSKEDLEQVGELTLYKGKPFSGVYVNYFEPEDTSDPSSPHKFEKHFRDGKLDGLYTIWNHLREKISETHYKNGEMNGNSTAWYSQGRKMLDENYKDGEKDGLQVYWSPRHGGKWHEAYYKNGEEDGVYTRYYDNGKKQVEKTFKNGIENGLRTEWSEDGKKTYQEHFIDGNAR